MKCHKCHKETSETRRCPFCGASLSPPTTSWKRPVAEASTAGTVPAATSAELSSAAGTVPAATSAELSSAEAKADATTAATVGTVGGADRVKDAEYLVKLFHVRHTDGTIQGPFTGAVVQSLYKHRKLEPYWEISEDQQTWMVVERVPWLKRGFDGAKIGEFAGKLGEKSADLQRKAAPVVAELSKRASPVVERVKRSPKVALAGAAVLIVLLYLMWPTSNRFQGNWIGFAKLPLLGSEKVTAAIKGFDFTMTDPKNDSIIMIGTLEIIGEDEARLTGLLQESRSNLKDANFDFGLIRLVGKDRMKITFPGTFLEISLNKAK